MAAIKLFPVIVSSVLIFSIQIINVASGDKFSRQLSPNFVGDTSTTVSPSSFISNEKELAGIFDCAICHATALGLLEILENPQTQNCIEYIAIKICEHFHIEDDMVCGSIIPLFDEEVMYIFGKLVVTPEQLCGLILPDSCRFDKPYHPRKSTWTVALPDNPKPPVVAPTLPPDNSPTIRVVHLSDIHYDKLYQVGSYVDCQEPLCCRLYENPTVNGSKETAGQWGNPNGNCDIPFWTLENLFQHLQNETFDYIIWTGDLPAHNVWNQTKSDQLTAYNVLTNLFLQYFPNKKIYSAVGNHESSPVNNYPPNDENLPEEFSISWLYDAFAQNWTNWVDKSQTDTIRSIASYVDKPFPGLRIISLNTMFCYSDNYWTLLNETDPDGTLSWLISQLQEAEDVGDKVHIIGHVLPGSCMNQWSLNYFNVIYRYENTVAGQFFGHSHSDQFSVFYENFTSSGRPFSMYYVGPSVTTYSDRNPAYRIYTVDGNRANSTWSVLNHETHFLNLTEVNEKNITNWQFEYDAKEAYGLSALFPEDWSNLITEMITNDTLFTRYQTFYDREVKPCNDECKRDLLCSARSAVSGFDNTLCSDISSTSSLSVSLETFNKLVKRLSKSTPYYGLQIDLPDQCKPVVGTTATPMVCTTPKCDCGGGAAAVVPDFTWFLTAFFLPILALFRKHF